MNPTPSLFTIRLLRQLIQRPASTTAFQAVKPTPIRSHSAFHTASRPQSSPSPFQSLFRASYQKQQIKHFSVTPQQNATYNQVRRGCRVAQRARKRRSPALKNRPEMKGVCLKTGVTKPKKPNSGERKIARIRLSSGKVVTAYIPGEGMAWNPKVLRQKADC